MWTHNTDLAGIPRTDNVTSAPEHAPAAAVTEIRTSCRANPRSPVLVDLHEYWESKLLDREMPARPDIDPTEIVHLLPYIILIDVEEAPERYRVRLVGTHVVDTLGRDHTGRYFDEVYPPEVYEKFVSGVRKVAGERRPLSGHGRVYFAAGREHIIYESLTLPLSSDCKTVDMLLMGLHVGVPPFEAC